MRIPIYVPTGDKTFTAASTTNKLLYYRCVGCNRDVIDPYPITSIATSSYTAQQSFNKKEAARLAAGENARSGLVVKDRLLFKEINEKRIYKGIDHAVICPYCGKVQPWSENKKVSSWIIGCVFLLILAAVIAWLPGRAHAPFTLPLLAAILLCVLLVIYFVRKIILQKKAVKEMQEPLPVYFNAENRDALHEEPYASILKQAFTCPACHTFVEKHRECCPNCKTVVNPQPWNGKTLGERKHKRGISLVCFCLALIFFCVSVWLHDVHPSYEIASFDQVPIQSVKTGQEYQADITVIDVYASKENKKNKVEKTLYLLGIVESQDDILVCNLKTEPDDDIYRSISRYAYDKNQNIGDLIVKGIFHVSRLDPVKTLSDYRDEALDAYLPKLEGVNGTKGINLLFEYYSLNNQSAYSQKKDQPWHDAAKVPLGLACVMLLSSVVVFFRSFMTYRDEDEDDEDEDDEDN